MKIALGSDYVGFKLKEILKEHLLSKGYEVEDLGAKSEDDKVFYADVAEKVALAVRDGGFSRGLLCCGTGIGMAITANKINGIYATVCHDVYSAERAQLSNNAKIITMGYRVIGPELAKTVLDAWLNVEFSPNGKSRENVEQVMSVEKKYMNK